MPAQPRTATLTPEQVSVCLRCIEIFQDLSEEQLEEIRRLVSVRQVEEGEVVFSEGEPSDSLYILQEGKVEVYARLTLLGDTGDRKGLSKTIVTLDATDRPFFGEMGLFGRLPRTATVKALTPATLLVIPNEGFDAACQADPLLGYLVTRQIAHVLCVRLRQANQDVLKLTTALSLALEVK